MVARVTFYKFQVCDRNVHIPRYNTSVLGTYRRLRDPTITAIKLNRAHTVKFVSFWWGPHRTECEKVKMVETLFLYRSMVRGLYYIVVVGATTIISMSSSVCFSPRPLNSNVNIETCHYKTLLSGRYNIENEFYRFYLFIVLLGIYFIYFMRTWKAHNYQP